MAVVIPLKLVYTPVDDTVTAIRNYQVPSGGRGGGVWGRVGLGFASCFASQGTRSGVPTPGSEGLSDQRSRFYLTTRSVAALAVRQGRDRWPPPLLGAGFSDRTRMLSFFAFDLRETSGSSESRGLLGVQRTPRSLAPRSYLSCSSERGLKGSSAHAICPASGAPDVDGVANPPKRTPLR